MNLLREMILNSYIVLIKSGQINKTIKVILALKGSSWVSTVQHTLSLECFGICSAISACQHTLASIDTNGRTC